MPDPLKVILVIPTVHKLSGLENLQPKALAALAWRIKNGAAEVALAASVPMAAMERESPAHDPEYPRRVKVDPAHRFNIAPQRRIQKVAALLQARGPILTNT